MQYYETNIQDYKIRLAEEKDTELILNFILELAEYEKLNNKVIATEEILFDSLFVRHEAEVIISEYKGTPIGFALFFHNFSTFLGKANLYIEDIFVKDEFRGKGFGKSLFSCLAKICLERDYRRIDWICLDWNEPSIDFYKKLGAEPLSDWTVFRLEGQPLNKLAN